MRLTLTLAYLSSGRLPPPARSARGRPREGSQAVGLLEECDPYRNRRGGRLTSPWFCTPQHVLAAQVFPCTPQSKCLQALTRGLLVPGALQLAKWDSMVPGANLNHTGLCGSQSYEVSFPVCKRGCLSGSELLDLTLQPLKMLVHILNFLLVSWCSAVVNFWQVCLENYFACGTVCLLETIFFC